GTIASGQNLYYRVDAQPGVDLRLTANFNVPAQAEFSVRYRGVPERSNFDALAPNLFDLRQEILLTSPQAGPHYVLLHGREAAAGGTAFSLTAQAVGLEVRGVSPNRGGNVGPATFTLTGAGFTPNSAVSLVSASGAERVASRVVFRDRNTLFVT